MLAVGEHMLGEVDERTLRITTSFSGGIGSTRQELCGALSAGIMLIGALHGRTQTGVDDHVCLELSARYRDAFVQEFGSSTCHVLRDGYENCPWLVEKASLVLLDIIDEGAGEENAQA